MLLRLAGMGLGLGLGRGAEVASGEGEEEIAVEEVALEAREEGVNRPRRIILRQRRLSRMDDGGDVRLAWFAFFGIVCFPFFSLAFFTHAFPPSLSHLFSSSILYSTRLLSVLPSSTKNPNPKTPSSSSNATSIF